MNGSELQLKLRSRTGLGARSCSLSAFQCGQMRGEDDDSDGDGRSSTLKGLSFCSPALVSLTGLLAGAHLLLPLAVGSGLRSHHGVESACIEALIHGVSLSSSIMSQTRICPGSMGGGGGAASTECRWANGTAFLSIRLFTVFLSNPSPMLVRLALPLEVLGSSTVSNPKAPCSTAEANPP